MRTVKKNDGLYRKKRLTSLTGVPLLVWLPIVLILASVIVILSLRIAINNASEIPGQPVVRKASWKIAALGDIACEVTSPNYNSGEGLVDACRMKEMGDALAREHLDAVLLLGDIQYPSGSFEDFERSFIPYFRDITVPIYATPGNHDYGDGSSLSGYKKAFKQYMPNVTYEGEGKSYYDFNLGPWKIYALDSNCQYVGGCIIGSDQHNWLTSKLTGSNAVCSIAFWHHPLFTSGVHRNDADIADRRDFWSMLNGAQNDIVLSGHDHHYERFAPKLSSGEVSTNGMRSFVSGAGGHSLRRALEPYEAGQEKLVDSGFGYLYMELYPSRYTWQYKTMLGDVLDEGSDSCR